MTNENKIQPQSPYKGLAPYDVTDKDNFFGRDRERQILLDKIFAYKVTLLFAGTGVGKSSLLRAAIIPILTEEHALDVVYYADWVSEPLDGLKTKIRERLIKNKKITDREVNVRGDLLPFLETCTAYASEPLILMLDQFEELFQYHARSGSLIPFVDQVAQVINAPNLPVSVVFAMREDFLAELNIFKSRIPGLFDNYYRLEQLRDQEARDAIQKPVAKFDFRYQPELLDQLIADLAAREPAHQAEASTPAAIDQEQARTVEPPYLQIVCNKLWETEKDNIPKVITLDRYVALGGTQAIVSKHFQQAMQHFSLRQQWLAFEMFRYLVTERGTKMAYRAEDLASSQLLGVDVAELTPILTYLASQDARVLRADQRLKQTWYELFHDVFARIIRDWTEAFQADENRRMYRQITKTAQKWVQDDRPDAALLRGAALLDAKDWRKRNRQETLAPDEDAFLRQSFTQHARGVWLRGGIVAVIVVFAIISAIASFYANAQSKEAQQQTRIAIIRSLVAYALQDNAEDERERAALLARHAYLLNQQYNGHVETQIEKAVRTIFHTDAILDPKESDSPKLDEHICQNVTVKRDVNAQEWTDFTGNALSAGDKQDCPPMYPLQLRSKQMTTADFRALSLNLSVKGDNWRPTHDVVNQFEDQGNGVILDKATGLLWQQSGSKEYLTYQAALAYVNTLNHEKFGGYDGWRLPTIEELLSLLEQDEQSVGSFFRLTAEAFDNLKSGDEPMPDDVLARLQPLQDQKILGETEFVSAVYQHLGGAWTERDGTRILEQAKNDYSLYINPLFDSEQTWVWSSDIYRMKGETAEAVWGVRFYSGDVIADRVNYHNYVRVVRSRQ